MEWSPYSSKLKAIGVSKETPELYEDLNEIWEGFRALDSVRTGSNPISFSEIESWLNLSGATDLDGRQEMSFLIRTMDESYLSFIRNRNANS